ncbi:MAG: copper amine oxidase N-terminal domain-containing protein [Clostridia bacterium]|nr:copper amine oxidase N-terminal domain-containing protein [Clostridia bacterium]
MKKTWIRLISLLIVTLLTISGVAFADDTGKAEVIFSATEKADDIIELDVTVKNTAFRILQTAVRYDKNVLMPVDDNNLKTEIFDDFASRSESAALFSEAGVSLEADKGLFGFTLYITPGARGEHINNNGEFEAYGDGTKLFKFRFKRISEGNAAFEIATKDDEKPFQPSLEEGLILLGVGKQLDAQVSFIYNEEKIAQTTITPTPKPEKPAEPQYTSSDRKKDVVMLQIGKALSISHGKKVKIDPDNDKVVPYITNDRTLVPIRFVAENLGAEVLWEEGWKYCIIKKGDKEIKLNFNSAEFEINGEKTVFDAPVELKFDRTMVPLRFVSEQLGCDVYWNDLNKAVVLSPADNPWQQEREAEITAFNEMLITISGLLP